MNKTEYMALVRRVEALEQRIAGLVRVDLPDQREDVLRRLDVIEAELKRRRGGRPRKIESVAEKT